MRSSLTVAADSGSSILRMLLTPPRRWKRWIKKALDEEAKQSNPEDTVGVVRATVRPSDKEKKPAPPAEKPSAPAGPSEGKGGKGGKGQGRREKQEAPQKREKKERSNATTFASAAAAGAEKHTKEKQPAGPKRLSRAQLDGVADKLFKALSEQDWVRAGECFAPSAQCFSPQRTGAKPQDFPGFKKTMGGMIGLLGKPQYLNVRRLYGQDSITEQHTTKFAQNNAARVEAEACVLLRVNPEGQITRLDEYLDPTVVLKAVQTASQQLNPVRK